MQHERASARRQISDYYFVYDLKNGELIGRLGDLSESGMRVISVEALPDQAILECRVVFPEPIAKASEVRVTARCVWCRENSQTGWYESGYVFGELTDGARSTILALTKKLLSDESQRINAILEAER